MSIYVPKYNGYVADVADQDFIRCDGTNFNFKKANATSVTNTANNITITGGRGAFPLAYIDTDRTFEIGFTSSEFSMDMFEMANTGSASNKDVGVYESDTFTVKESASTLVVELPFEINAASTKIRGLEYTSGTIAAGKFTIEVTNYAAAVGEGAPTPAKSVITFNTGDVAVGDEIVVTYKRRIIDAHIVTIADTTRAAKGEVSIHFPVYSSGDDCSAAAVKGVVHICVPRMRVTAPPGVDLSYKSAATNAITFAAMDPHRSDKKICDIIYEEYTTAGTINTVTTTATVDYD